MRIHWISSRTHEVRGRIADHANTIMSHVNAWEAPLSASHFPGAAQRNHHTTHIAVHFPGPPQYWDKNAAMA
jgi:hypothetical protein